jgi:hypothetical protein
MAAVLRQFEAAGPFLKAMPPLPPEGFGERRALGKALRGAGGPGAPDLDVDPLAGDHPLLRALWFARRTLGHLEGEVPPLASARLVGGALRGTYRLAAGYDGLRDVVRRRIAEARGELLGASGPPAIAEGFDVDGGRVASVRLQGSSNAWVARVFVAATDSPAIARLLPEAARRKVEELGRIRTTRQLLAVNLVVKTAALPPALGESVLALLREDAGDGLDDAILFQVLPARRETRKGTGDVMGDERVVCAAGFAPADTAPAQVPELARRIRAVLADVIPFFERHLVAESVPALAAPAERVGARLGAHPLYEVGTEQALGITGLPGRALKNLVFAGREVVPGLGVEGEFHAGVQAAAAAQALLGRRDLLKK